MRILHTSDWHLGRSFHRVGMLDHQAAVLDALVEVVRAERVDAVVVAGDVYDRALPSVDAVEVLDEALHRLLGAGAQVLLTSGNHDSAARLGFGGRSLERAGLHLRTRVADAARPVELTDAHGPVALYGVPYLEPGLVAGPLGVARSHTAVLGEVAGRVRADLADRRRGDGARGRTRALLAAHAFVVGGEASGDERDITVGGVGSVPVGTLLGGAVTGGSADPGRPDYLALGHLHGRQVLAEQVRYSGSPLAYAFSEAGRAKGHWLVELGPSGVDRVDAVDVAPPRQLALLRGRLTDLLTAPEHRAAEDAWCQVVLTDPERPREPMAALRTRFTHVLVLSWEPEVAPGARLQRGYAERVAGLDEEEMCCSFVDHVRGRPVGPAERALLRAALEATRPEVTEADHRPAPTGADLTSHGPRGGELAVVDEVDLREQRPVPADEAASA
ncbi:Exodeoxyribonuclease I subunit D [Quadrisphaera granulorum]|uniref:Nuclease SbcCD subunit D n=1 Tax=Quadrisphaera granulorum TaxID=317664 RepID=A0A316ACT7_9ACTN|nr:exonuclease SbcCD subunit D [Quadrisphaera granulorum]PWJ54704.1 exodeoxyribonuclease I subunit D [Quadrisphaera granulorum]SZE96066.1 Exodeoxyribonuclease I subunit D [Quadrisphaera granulorum]